MRVLARCIYFHHKERNPGLLSTFYTHISTMSNLFAQYGEAFAKAHPDAVEKLTRSERIELFEKFVKEQKKLSSRAPVQAGSLGTHNSGGSRKRERAGELMI